MQAVLTEIINLLVGGISGIATGIGQGLAILAREMFTTYSVADNVYTITGLNTFGALVAVFAGISLAVGLSRLIYHWVSSLGARN